MRLIWYSIFLFTFCSQSFGQKAFHPQPDYFSMTSNAFTEYLHSRNSEDFKRPAMLYDSIFAIFNDCALSADRYNAGISWALSGNKEKAFKDLFKAAKKDGYTDIKTLLNAGQVSGINKDGQWDSLIKSVQRNINKSEITENRELASRLDTVFQRDQCFRLIMDSVSKNFGNQSKQMDELWKKIIENDSVNLVEVSSILDKYGWPSPEEVGQRGDQAIFLVVQHSDSATQVKYFPLVKDAAKIGGVSYAELAMLEDRILWKQGKPQIYGTQLFTDSQTGKMKFFPIEDESNVDKRRASVGLMSLEDYAKSFGIDYKLPPPQK